MLLYPMWLACNDARDNKTIEDPKGIIERVWSLLDDWLWLHDEAASSVYAKGGVTSSKGGMGQGKC